MPARGQPWLLLATFDTSLLLDGHCSFEMTSGLAGGGPKWSSRSMARPHFIWLQMVFLVSVSLIASLHTGSHWPSTSTCMFPEHLYLGSLILLFKLPAGQGKQLKRLSALEKRHSAGCWEICFSSGLRTRTPLIYTIIIEPSSSSGH